MTRRSPRGRKELGAPISPMGPPLLWAENLGFFALIERCIRLRVQVDIGLVFQGFGRMQYIQRARDDRD